jgi:para-nitrobenzyl esterase
LARSSLAEAFAAALLISIALALGGAARAGIGTPDVPTESGPVRGLAGTDADRFLGIPYAAPPVGPLRFAPPAPVAPWKTPLAAFTLPPACPQLVSTNGPESIEEDCLRLSVYRPPAGAPGAPYPVLVWIHGGGLLNGSGAQQDGTAFARDTGTIVVTVSYRLGVFGFLAHPALTAESADASSGNAGFLDQQAALGWVQRNIAAFGGDPARVTVGGQSAGGASVCAHLASPASAGLFAHAAIHSGGFVIPGSGIPPCGLDVLADAEAVGTTFAEAAGCSASAAAPACLRALSAADLLAASGAFSASLNRSGTALPAALPDAIAAGDWNEVPILLGTTRDEAQAGVQAFPGYPLSEDGYEFALNFLFADLAAKVLRKYPAARYADPAFAISAVATDTGFACPTHELRTLLAKHTTVYGFEFADPAPPPGENAGFPLGAYHTADVQYLFGYTPFQGAFTADQQALSDEMIRYWAAFAASGDPAVAGAPKWPRYKNATKRVLELRPDGSRTIRSFAGFHKCRFWKVVD